MDTKATTATKTSDFPKAAASPAFREMQQYGNKVLEFAHANANAAFEFAQRACRVKSSAEFVELSSEHARANTRTFTDQATQLAELAQKVALACAKLGQDGVS